MPCFLLSVKQLFGERNQERFPFCLFRDEATTFSMDTSTSDKINSTDGWSDSFFPIQVCISSWSRIGNKVMLQKDLSILFIFFSPAFDQSFQRRESTRTLGTSSQKYSISTNLIYYFSLLFKNDNTWCLGMLAFLNAHWLFTSSPHKQFLLLEHSLIGNEICQELADCLLPISQSKPESLGLWLWIKCNLLLLLCLMHVNKREVNYLIENCS